MNLEEFRMIQRVYWPTENWHTANPEEAGMDPAILNGLDPLIRSRHKNIKGIVIVRGGNIVYEKYYHRATPADVHNVASVTKSVTSALVGIAIGDGLIKSLDQKVMDFFPEYAGLNGGGCRADITLRHLLTMTAPYPFPDWREPLTKLPGQKDWVKFALDMLGNGGEPGRFKYCTSGAHLLSAVLTRVLGKSAREYANGRLFGPTGMRFIPENPKQGFTFFHIFDPFAKGWLHDPAGNSTGGMGLTLTARDMARFGYLYLNGGRWDGRQVVPESWVDASWQPAVKAMGELEYGYLWWLGEEGGVPVKMAMGDGGNMICCVPSMDLVVAVAAKMARNSTDRVELLRRCILPAVKGA
jgi:CubicO group peptidase (beta-lactamase class C family)